MQWIWIQNNIDIYNEWCDLKFLHCLKYEYECLIPVVNTIEYNVKIKKGNAFIAAGTFNG